MQLELSLHCGRTTASASSLGKRSTCKSASAVQCQMQRGGAFLSGWARAGGMHVQFSLKLLFEHDAEARENCNTGLENTGGSNDVSLTPCTTTNAYCFKKRWAVPFGLVSLVGTSWENVRVEAKGWGGFSAGSRRPRPRPLRRASRQ